MYTSYKMLGIRLYLANVQGKLMTTDWEGPGKCPSINAVVYISYFISLGLSVIVVVCDFCCTQPRCTKNLKTVVLLMTATFPAVIFSFLFMMLFSLLSRQLLRDKRYIL